MPFGYTAEYQGDYNDLVYLRARMYAPGMGRFVNRDIWSGDANKPLSFNHLEYVEGNPINYIDPLGRWTMDRNIELIAGGFYGLGRLKIAEWIPNFIGLETDIFVPPLEDSKHTNDIQYLEPIRKIFEKRDVT